MTDFLEIRREHYEPGKCLNCKEPVDLKVGDEVPGIGIIAEGADDLCRKCLSIGWVSGPEMEQALLEDPELAKTIHHASPYFQPNEE